MAINMRLRGLQATKAALNEDYTKLINQAQRNAAFNAVDDLIAATSVDTGRASSSWSVNKSKALIDRKEVPFDGSPTILLGPVPSDKIETLYITNGTPYIIDLNAGSSRQSPARFIETTIAKYFNAKGTIARVI